MLSLKHLNSAMSTLTGRLVLQTPTDNRHLDSTQKVNYLDHEILPRMSISIYKVLYLFSSEYERNNLPHSRAASGNLVPRKRHFSKVPALSFAAVQSPTQRDELKLRLFLEV